MLVTERPGRIRVIQNGQLKQADYRIPGIRDGLNQHEAQERRNREPEKESPKEEPAYSLGAGCDLRDGIPHHPAHEDRQRESAAQQKQIVRDLVNHTEHIRAPGRRDTWNAVIGLFS